MVSVSQNQHRFVDSGSLYRETQIKKKQLMPDTVLTVLDEERLVRTGLNASGPSDSWSPLAGTLGIQPCLPDGNVQKLKKFAVMVPLVRIIAHFVGVSFHPFSFEARSPT